MACTSGSVQTVSDKTVAAKAEIDKLQKMLMDQEDANKKAFFDTIQEHLSNAQVTDARELTYASDIKTEYTSEFSLDKIAAVVKSALQAAAAAQDPSVKSPAMSPKAIAAYTDVVNTVAEAAKSSSTSSASLSFSMNRLSPGLFAFLYATSVNIKNEDTFGSEAVTSTAIYYRIMQSIEDVNNDTKFGEVLIDANNLLNMKQLQAALTDDLASGKLDIDEWMRKDGQYSEAVQTIQARLAADSSDHTELAAASSTNQAVVRTAVQKLTAMGEAHKVAIDMSQARLASKYY